MTGIKIPYIVTIEDGSSQIVGIRRNYEKDDPKKMKKQYFVHYKFLPGSRFLWLWFNSHDWWIIENSYIDILRQLIRRRSTLSNLPAGFKSRGIRMRDDADPLQPGEFRDIDAPNGDLRNSFMPLPYKEPSQTLVQSFRFCRSSQVSDLQPSLICKWVMPIKMLLSEQPWLYWRRGSKNHVSDSQTLLLFSEKRI